MKDEDFTRWAVVKECVRQALKLIKKYPDPSKVEVQYVRERISLANAQTLALENSLKGIKTDESTKVTPN